MSEIWRRHKENNHIIDLIFILIQLIFIYKITCVHVYSDYLGVFRKTLSAYTKNASRPLWAQWMLKEYPSSICSAGRSQILDI